MNERTTAVVQAFLALTEQEQNDAYLDIDLASRIESAGIEAEPANKSSGPSDPLPAAPRQPA